MIGSKWVGALYTMLQSYFDFNRLMISTNLWFMCFLTDWGYKKSLYKQPTNHTPNSDPQPPTLYEKVVDIGSINVTLEE